MASVQFFTRFKSWCNSTSFKPSSVAALQWRTDRGRFSAKGRPKRRPLIQGKLVVTDSSSDLSALGSSLLDSRNDIELDPTLSPRRLVPQLTEKASPRPEPPSSSLDLSDVDLDVKEAASNFQHRSSSHPVMVYDACEPVKDSPHSCEMSLSVGTEESPARVVCHTPSRLDKIRNSPRPALSPLAVTVNMPATDRSNSSFKPDRLSRTLFPDDDQDEKAETEDDEVQFKRKNNELGLHISHHSRGIIEEILAHEMGDSNIEKVSLHSESCSPRAQNSSAGLPSSSIFSVSTSSQSKDMEDSTSYRPKQQSTSDYDDAGSVSEACSVDEYVGPNSATKPKKSASSSTFESAKPVFRRPLGNEPTPSVKQKKKGGRQVASRYMQSAANRKTNTASSSQNSSKGNAVPKNSNTVGKALQERPASSTHRKETRPMSTSLGKGKTVRSGTLRTGSTIKHSVDLDQKTFQSSKESPRLLSVRGEAVGGGTGTEVKASTPVGDNPCAMSYIDASAIQSTTNMFVNSATMHFDTMMEESLANADMTKVDKVGDSENVKKRPVSASRGAGDGGEGHKVTQFDLDIAYARYLQWQFLAGRARQAFINQQQQACAQLHGLWQLTEARRQEVAQLEMDNARLRSMVLLDGVLDKMEQELSPLVDSLPAVTSEYGQMATALDGTCHQLPVTDIYLPAGGDPAREAMEERMATTLHEAEHLLTEINVVGKKKGQDLQQDLSQYVACLATLEKTSAATTEELQQCRQGLEEARSLNTRLASLRIQDRQSTF
ncbi:HAUS augmin-like complex subunit 8 [Elysia marginata]|uniref:HAUS augmin-like complex subunit 8 n=1 Tax=Elysia marginata TaxID=1093978 RepID=A0AAV4H137_9GAST|nr:HAUS augmin-like complex subunit 8 [Elysia marginata]